MPVTIICQICATPFQVDPYRAKTALYCSNACRGKSLIKPDVTAICEQCGTPFVVKRFDRFCSPACRKQSQIAKLSGRGLPRFWTHVQKCDHDGDLPCAYCCWPWQGALYVTGYGQVQIGGVKALAHRIAWQLWNKRPVPPFMVVAHYCFHRPCCNPMHLHACSQADNIADGVRDKRHAFGERQGHSKFTDQTALEALTLYHAGWRIQQIADHFGVTFATTQSLCLGETWKHLPRP
jgi:hypothetical protein